MHGLALILALKILAPSAWESAYLEGRFFDLLNLTQERKPQTPPEQMILGFVRSGQNRTPDAVKALSDAIPTLNGEWKIRAFEHLGAVHARVGQYGRAAETFQRAGIECAKQVPASKLADLENTRKLFASIADVPPMELVGKGPATLKVDPNPNLKIPFRVGGNDYVLSGDTGADFSLVREGIGKEMGLRMTDVQINLGSITGKPTTAWMGVGKSIEFGQLRVENPVFLVMRDEDLTFKDFNFRLDGVIGLPILMRLGVSTFASDGTITLNGSPRPGSPNLFLNKFKPYVLGEYGGQRLTFAFDSGANRTMFYRGFYDRFQAELDAKGEPAKYQFAGVSGSRELPSLRLRDLVMRIAGKKTKWPEVHVLTDGSLGDNGRNLGNVGTDVLSQFKRFTFDWTSMRLVLEQGEAR